MTSEQTYSAFADFQHHLCTVGDVATAVAAAREALLAGRAACVVLFDDATGERTEIDHPDHADHVLARFATPGPRGGPGRPKLGVVSREVSLLPRHWEWLADQPGGASAAIRRLVDEARRRHPVRDAARVARDAAYKFMSAVGGDLPGFEEAARALYAGDDAGVAARLAGWPVDLRDHLLRLVRRAAELRQAAEQEAAGNGG